MIKAEPSGKDARNIRPRALESIDVARRARVATIAARVVFMIRTYNYDPPGQPAELVATVDRWLGYNASHGPSDDKRHEYYYGDSDMFPEPLQQRCHYQLADEVAHDTIDPRAVHRAIARTRVEYGNRCWDRSPAE